MVTQRELALTPGAYYTIETNGTNGNGGLVTFIQTEPDLANPDVNVARVIPHTRDGALRRGEPVAVNLVPPQTLRRLQ